MRKLAFILYWITLLFLMKNLSSMEAPYRKESKIDLDRIPQTMLELVSKKRRIYKNAMFLNEINKYYYLKLKTNYLEKIDSPLNKNCPICLDDHFDNNQMESQLVVLKCLHGYHHFCLKDNINVHVKSENIRIANKCPFKNCNSKLTAQDLGLLFTSEQEVYAYQKMVVHSIASLAFCPRCEHGMALVNKISRFITQCSYCKMEVCFNCGRDAHYNKTCKKMEQEDDSANSEIILLYQLINLNQDSKYGKCPYCGILMMKLDGCNSMICGANSTDKNFIGNYKGRGCGKRFLWNTRIPIKEYLLYLEINALPNLLENASDLASREQIKYDLGLEELVHQEEVEEVNVNLTQTELEFDRRNNPDFRDRVPRIRRNRLEHYVAARFEGQYVAEMYLIRMDIREANFTGANIGSIRFDYCRLQRSIFAGASILTEHAPAYFIKSNLENADFTGAYLNRSLFMYSILRGARFVGAQCKGCSFEGSDLRGADFTNADIRNVDFSGAIIDNIIIDNAKVQNVNCTLL